MPNHVSIKLSFESNEDTWKETHEKFKEFQALVEHDDYSFDFGRIIPCPDDVYQGNLGRDEEAKYPGEKNWYGWNIKNWGTKWNAYEVSWNFDEVLFQTAWSIPDPVLLEISKKFPEQTVLVEYADEDSGSNCGIIRLKNGQVIGERTNETDHTYPWILFAQQLYYEVSYHHESDEKIKLMQAIRDEGYEITWGRNLKITKTK